jgi:hypothetical protein
MTLKLADRRAGGAMLIVMLVTLAVGVRADEPARSPITPLQPGERVLFIGNSLTANLPDQLNALLAASGFAEEHGFAGHRLQIWNQTLQTHWTLSEPTHPELFRDQPMFEGYRVHGRTSLWRQGQYDVPEFNDRGYILAVEAIRMGSPDGEPWDRVVLQTYAGADQANTVVEGDAGQPQLQGPMLRYASLLIDEVRAVGAEPIIYQPWLASARLFGGIHNDAPWAWNAVFDRQARNHRLLAEATGVAVIPLGDIMRSLSTDRRPDAVPATSPLEDDFAPEQWLTRDNVHATAPGHAMRLYTMAATLTGRSAHSFTHHRDMTDRPHNPDHYVLGQPERRYGITITPAIDARIKDVVDQQLHADGWTLRPASAPTQ